MSLAKSTSSNARPVLACTFRNPSNRIRTSASATAAEEDRDVEIPGAGRSGYALVDPACSTRSIHVLSTVWVKYLTSAGRTTATRSVASSDRHRYVRA